MLSTIAFLLSLQAKSVELPGTLVNTHLQAMTVSQALTLISKASKVALSADDTLKHDIVLIRAQATPLATLGKQLALALHSDWSASGTGFVLSRSADGLKSEQAEQLKFDSDAFVRTQTHLKASDLLLGDWDAQAAKTLAKEMLDAQADAKATPDSLRKLESQTPVMRLFTRIMASIPPEDLAQIPPWGRIVYTIRPNKAQRPMPPEAVQALIAFKSDQIVWADTAEPFANLNLGAGLASARPFRSPPSKIFLSFHRDEALRLQTEMRLVDSVGLNITVLQSELSPTYEPAPLPTIQDPDAPVFPFPATSALTQTLHDTKDLKQSGKESLLRPLLASPETADPLATLPAEVIDAASQTAARNMVAVIPDEAFGLCKSLPLEKLTKAEVWKALQDLNLFGTVDGDWLRLEPERMASSHEERLDRGQLAALLNAAPDGPAHLEAIAAIADSPGGIARTELFMDVLSVWSHSLHDQVASIDWVALRVFGALTEAQRQVLQSGGEMNVLEASPEAQRSVRELIDRGLFSTPKTTRNSVSFLALQPLEQTNMLPDGIPPDATLGGVFVVKPLASTPPPAGRLASDDDKRIPLSDALGVLAAGSPLEYGMSYSLDLKVHIYPSLYSGGLLSENYYMGLAKATRDLPAPYVQALARYQKD